MGGGGESASLWQQSHLVLLLLPSKEDESASMVSRPFSLARPIPTETGINRNRCLVLQGLSDNYSSAGLYNKAYDLINDFSEM